jgi:hypothetical protein
MPMYYGCYRVDSSSHSDNQYEALNASTQNKYKEMIQKKFPGCKITWVHSPQQGSKPPSWFKG